jgi:hypothetical protein
MAPRSHQDMDWSDPIAVAHQLVAEMVAGHENREVSAARFRERQVQKDAEVKKSQGPSNCGEVYKFVAER